MPSEEHKIKQFLSKYHHPDATKVDVMSVIGFYQGLSCKLEPFVFNDGSQKELANLQGTIPVIYKVFSNGTKKNLLNLTGTIPIDYKGNVYNIPVCVWVMDTHPYNAPICYVKPTPDMQIKVSKYVDHNGKVYLPYLHDWQPNTYNLLGLIQVMIMIFGEQPPVYSKPRDGSATQSQSTPYPTQPSMPMPGVRPTGSTPYPPYPPYPVANPAYPGASGYPQQGPGYPPNPTAAAGYPPYPPYPQAAGAAAGSPYPPYPTGTSQPPPQTAFPSFAGYPPTSNASPSTASGSGTITEEHIRASLLSAVEDKLRRRLREQFSQGTAELETLRRTNQELGQGKGRLETLVSRLEREGAELDKSIAVLQEKEAELDKALSRLTEQEPIDVDEAVTTTAPLYKQLLTAFAEESATEDAIYYLGEALRQGVIDLDVFLKQVRTLSRKQFMLRALMHRCRQKAGLAG